MAQLVKVCTMILGKWRNYSDEERFIFAYTDEDGVMTPHNTITPIARMRGELYEMDLVLRNNITTCEHPLGVYHPHSEYHHIKKENIGLIEVMGMAILPARLRDELSSITALTEAQYRSTRRTYISIRIAENEKSGGWPFGSSPKLA